MTMKLLELLGVMFNTWNSSSSRGGSYRSDDICGRRKKTLFLGEGQLV